LSAIDTSAESYLFRSFQDYKKANRLYGKAHDERVVDCYGRLCKTSLLSNQRNQIGQADVSASLRDQRAGLTAMVRLMIKKMGHRLPGRVRPLDPLAIAVTHDELRVAVGHVRDPDLDGSVELLALGAQCLPVVEKERIESTPVRQIQHRRIQAVQRDAVVETAPGKATPPGV
jgi:hypothetical protein